MSNYIGKKYNSLTVISKSHTHRYVQANGKKQSIHYFNCVCDCGKEVTLRASQLHNQKSCGCARVASNISRTLDITGKVYSRLTAIKRLTSGEWECHCSCGNTTMVSVDNLNSGNTKSCGCLQKEYASMAMTNILMGYRESLGKDPTIPLSTDYKIKRAYFLPIAKEVYKRDSYTCVWCSKTACMVNAHHIETWAQSPELRFDLSNLVTLCEDCHQTVHGGNYIAPPNTHMSILLQGYVKVIDDYNLATAARMEISAE